MAASKKTAKGKAKAKTAKARKPTEDRKVKALPFQTNGVVAGMKGSSFKVSGVLYKGKTYGSLWQVWGKRGRFQDVNHAGPDGQNIGTRSQCITFRKVLRAAKPNTQVKWENPDTGKVHVFKTVRPGEGE